jgi:hypothetical protein
MAESERKTCVNNGCNFGRPSDGKFCSFCTKIGPATEQIRENTIKLYKKAQLHFLNRSISKYVIPNHHLFFINGSMENSYELFCFMREKSIFISLQQALILVDMRGFPHLWYSLVYDRWNLIDVETPGCYYYKSVTRPDLSISLNDSGSYSFSIDPDWFNHNNGIPIRIISRFFKKLPLDVCSIICKYIRPIDKIYGNPINEQDYKDPYKKTSCCLLFNQEHNVVEQLSHHHVNQQMVAISIT